MDDVTSLHIGLWHFVVSQKVVVDWSRRFLWWYFDFVALFSETRRGRHVTPEVFAIRTRDNNKLHGLNSSQNYYFFHSRVMVRLGKSYWQHVTCYFMSRRRYTPLAQARNDMVSINTDVTYAYVYLFCRVTYHIQVIVSGVQVRIV